MVTTPPVILPFDFSAVIILWLVVDTIGLTTTGNTTFIRRGAALTSPQVYTTGVVLVTAATAISFSGFCVDSNPGAAMPQYSLSMAGTGTTGAYQVPNNVQLFAFVL